MSGAVEIGQRGHDVLHIFIVELDDDCAVYWTACHAARAPPALAIDELMRAAVRVTRDRTDKAWLELADLFDALGKQGKFLWVEFLARLALVSPDPVDVDLDRRTFGDLLKRLGQSRIGIIVYDYLWRRALHWLAVERTKSGFRIYRARF
jgi:hypothetical protein